MEQKYHTITIIVYDKKLVYQKVGELLHKFSEKILLRTGYPLRDKDVAVIFIIVEMTNDELGALTGKLGQINSVKVSSTTLKI